jgi:hypothetical protein
MSPSAAQFRGDHIRNHRVRPSPPRAFVYFVVCRSWHLDHELDEPFAHAEHDGAALGVAMHRNLGRAVLLEQLLDLVA